MDNNDVLVHQSWLTPLQWDSRILAAHGLAGYYLFWSDTGWMVTLLPSPTALWTHAVWPTLRFMWWHWPVGCRSCFCEVQPLTSLSTLSLEFIIAKKDLLFFFPTYSLALWGNLPQGQWWGTQYSSDYTYWNPVLPPKNFLNSTQYLTSIVRCLYFLEFFSSGITVQPFFPDNSHTVLIIYHHYNGHPAVINWEVIQC